MPVRLCKHQTLIVTIRHINKKDPCLRQLASGRPNSRFDATIMVLFRAKSAASNNTTCGTTPGMTRNASR
jgi:hypothetical protein